MAKSNWVRRRIARRAASYDAVHVYTQSCGLLSGASLARYPSVVTLDSTNARNAYRLPYRHPTRFTPLSVQVTRPFEQRVFRSAGALVADSQWAAASLLDDYGVVPDKVTVIPFGINVPPLASLPPRTARGPARIVFIGTTLDRKGGRALLDLHQKRFADRCELILVTKERVAPAPNVTVVNDLEPGDPRLWSFLRSATVFAFPSEMDQAPNVVLEAAAAGLPVVALDVAALPEMVRHGETGLLVDRGDQRGLAAAIARLLDDPEGARAMGEAGRPTSRPTSTWGARSSVCSTCSARWRHGDGSHRVHAGRAVADVAPAGDSAGRRRGRGPAGRLVGAAHQSPRADVRPPPVRAGVGHQRRPGCQPLDSVVVASAAALILAGLAASVVSTSSRSTRWKLFFWLIIGQASTMVADHDAATASHG